MSQKVKHTMIWYAWIFIWAWILVWIYNILYFFIPSSYLWGYDYIKPLYAEYNVWDSISFNTSRYSKWDYPVIFNEFVYCIEWDRSILITDSVITEWTYRKWEILASFTLWWEENPILLLKEWENCRLQTCQDVTFMWKVKHQCFTSNPTFDIIWE